MKSLVDRPLAVFGFFVAAYLATWAGHLDSGDSSFRIAWAKSMLYQHTARIDGAGLGASYCKYSIGHSVLAMPFLLAAEAVRRVSGIHAEGPIYMLLFVLNAALFLTLAAKYLRLRFGPTETRRTLLILGFCTVWLPCSRMDNIEPFVLTFLFAGFLTFKLGRPLLGMYIASCAITVRPDSIIPVALLGVWHLTAVPGAVRTRLAIRMALACLPALAVNAFANWIRWGTPLEAGYAGETFSAPFLSGLDGILFSSGKSIFLYSPPLVLGVAALIRYARTGQGTRDYWFFASVLISEALLYANWWDWSGDDAWGVRFLNPGVVLMCIPAAEFVSGARWPKLAATVALAGLVVQSLAVLVDPMAADYVIRHYPLPRAAVYQGDPAGIRNRIDLEDIRFNPRYSPLAVNWLLLRLLAHLPPAPQTNSKEIERTGMPLYDALLAGGWNPNTVECDLFWARMGRIRK
jgi:hypothetical protein